MRDPGSHIIRKTSVNFNFTGNFDGLALQQEVSGWTRAVLVPAIESALSEYDNTEDVISIDRISLDIDTGQTGDWKSVLQEMIIRQLRQKIGDKMFVPSKDVSIKPATLSFADVLRFYLELGFLPWNVFFKNTEEFENVLNSWIENASSSEIKKAILGLRDEKSLVRLNGLLNRQSLEILISVFSRNSREKVQLILGEIESVIHQLTGENNLREQMIAGFISIYLQTSVVSYPVGTLFDIIAEWLEYVEDTEDADIAIIQTGKITNPEIVNIIRKLQKEMISGTLRHKEKKSRQLEIQDPGKVKYARKSEDRLKKELQEGIYINNAGAVILAPFLPLLFSRTGLVREDKIIDTAHALSLLNYCISGKRMAYEFELPLPAILCGISPGTITGLVTVEDEEMIREADEMLASVIEYWTSLKGTSVEGLREAFLQRNGKLVYAEDEWLLIVEQKPYDMLLEQLPWNISMISLPWMKEVLKTQWI